MRVAVEVVEAIEEAHRNQVDTRDLKPANIMLTPNRHVKVMDFGVAIRLAPIPTGDDDTKTSGLSDLDAGTLAYMSPEQLVRQPPDPRSDLFSFGVMFYQMISGVHPFTRSASIDTASAILNDPLPSVPALGEATTSLKYILAKLVAKDPEARHRSATAVLIDLRELQRESDAAMPQVLGSHHDSFADCHPSLCCRSRI